jgi:hypothetical protein
MRHFLARFILAAIGMWLSATLVPGVETDGALPTFLLMGLLIAVGEVALQVIQRGTAILLFFLPQGLRVVLLRVGMVAIAAALVTDFTFTPPILVGLLGTTLLLSLLFLLPFAS